MTRIATALVLLMAAGSCGRGGGGGTVKRLDGALGEIPVFAPATLVERTDAFTSDTFEDLMKFSSYTWHLRTTRPPAEVEAFYLAQWPGAGRVVDEEAVYLRDPPLPVDEDEDDGVEPPLGESTSVTIQQERVDGRTRFSISEDVFAHRRP